MQIRRYYDLQTDGFLALGQGGGEAAIHRAVWGPGVTTRSAAFHFVEDQIADALARVAPGGGRSAPHVVDLGCGVGGSLTYLASRAPIRGTGITLSPVQARIAARRIEGLKLADRLTCVEGDYTALPGSVAPADLAFAIESFVHGPSPEAFFAECARLVRPGGVLVICDDLRRPTTAPSAAPALERYQRGWHVNTLLTREELIGHAEAAGFTHDHTTNLTPWLELGRPRDIAIDLFVALFGWLPLHRTPLGHLVGGSALHRCLTRGWIGYDIVWLRRVRIESEKSKVTSER
jgi:cyclopropane fatty-acyl-phospholipid synthase-like methyltransferase